MVTAGRSVGSDPSELRSDRKLEGCEAALQPALAICLSAEPSAEGSEPSTQPAEGCAVPSLD
jgi:hypothetical protein